MSVGPSTILDDLRPGSFVLNLNGRPFRQSQDNSWSIKGAVYNDYDLFVCYGGAARFTISGLAYDLQQGYALLCPPGSAIEARKTSPDNFLAIAQHFDLLLGGVTDFFNLIDYSPLARLSDWPMAGDYFNHYVDMGERDKSASIRESLFTAVLFSFIRDAFIGERIGPQDKLRFVFDMAGKLERNLASPGALDLAMRDVPYSRDYAVRVFRKKFGFPPTEYLLRCRMNAARDYLLAGLSVKETAQRVGIGDELYFSRIFAKREGASPREFRRSHGAKA